MTTAPELENVADVYPLTPIQEGMLFHTIAAPESGVFVGQFTATIDGDLDVDAFRRAWAELVRRHAALRTIFVWEGLDDPLQVVRADADIPITEHDWRDLDPDEQARRIAERLAGDRRRGFDPAEAPLLRMELINTGPRAWRWIWTAHHIILDGWSTSVLIEELQTTYAALRADAAGAPAADESFPYRRYVAWHEGRDRDATRAFWQRELAGFTAPTRVARPPATSGAARGHARFRRALPSGLTETLAAFGRTHRLTPSTLVQGAWALLLSRASRESDVVFGVTTSGRPPELEGIERAVGVYINTLPLRVEIDETRDVVAWLQDLQRHHLEIRSREHSSLADVQRWSDVPAGEALFESIVVFENYPGSLGGGAESALPLRDIEFIEQSNYPLAVLFMPGPAPEFVLVYDRARFDEVEIRGLTDQLVHLLADLSRADGRVLRDLESIPPADRARLLDAGRGDDVPAPDAASMDALILDAGRGRPEEAALVDPERTLAFADLDAGSARLAGALRAAGVGPGSLVGLHVDRGVELGVGILAILRAGAAYVPLDPAYPAAHLQRVADDAKLEVILTTSARADGLHAFDARIVTFDDAGATAAPDDPPHDPDRPAYVIHTSGSTGHPKGVVITHRNLIHSTAARIRFYGGAPGRFLLLSSYAFDSSVAGIFWSLASGGTLVLPPTRIEQDMRQLVALIREHRITHLLCLPAIHGLILEHAGDDQLASLEAVILAGEACSPGLVREHHRQLPRVRLFNEYGPTEATVWCTVHELTPADADGPVPIGRPIDRTRVYVLDPRHRPVAEGMPGEIHVAGAGLARGYLHDDALTARRFVDLDLDGRRERVYRTGDLGTFRPDGTLDFLGRADTQVKVRGHRIEPSGVESLLRAHPAIDDAAVEARSAGDGPGHARLVAWIVAAPPSDAVSAVDDWREELGRQWPAFMVPDAIVTLPALPRLANGKIDRRALPAPDAADAGRPYVAPRDDTEAAITAIFAELLDVERIGVHDDFFALGGDSLVSIRVMSRIEDRFGTRLPLATLLERGTVAGLATRLRNGATDVRAESLVPIRASGDLTPLFCVHAGGGHVLEYKHLADQLDPRRPVYGLEPIGLDGRKPPLERIDAMAAHYLKAVRAVQPHGPYLLVGHCVGATICYEMAQQLTAAGERVDLLVVIDSGAPGGHRRRSRTEKLIAYAKKNGLRTVGYAAFRAMHAARQRLVRPVARGVQRRLGDAERRRVAHVDAVRLACDRAYYAYEGVPSRVPILQIRSSEFTEVVSKEHHEGWDRYSPDIEVHVIEARHRIMLLEPTVGGIARLIAERLDRLEEGTP